MCCSIIEYKRNSDEIMKKLIFTCLAAGVLAGGSSSAQTEASPAAAQAQKEYIEESFKSITTAIEGLVTSQASLQKRLSALERDLAQLREEIAKRPSNVVTRDELKPFEEKLIEFNKKREDDKRLILDKLEQLAKIPPPVAPLHRSAPAPNGADKADKPDKPEKGYEYEVRPGDTLSTIVAAYRQQGIKVTQDQVLKANPNLKPERLLPRQKIFIPDPAQN
jgi:hypothetical protein